MSECPIQVQNRAVRGDHRLAARDQSLGRVRACDAGPRRQGGEGSGHADPGAGHHRRHHLCRRDFYSRGPGPKTRKKYLLVACTNLLTWYPAGPADRRVADGRRWFRDSGRAFHGPTLVTYDPRRGGPQPTYRWCRRNLASATRVRSRLVTPTGPPRIPPPFGLPAEDDGSQDDPLVGQSIVTCNAYRHDFDALRAASTCFVIGVGAKIRPRSPAGQRARAKK